MIPGSRTRLRDVEKSAALCLQACSTCAIVWYGADWMKTSLGQPAPPTYWDLSSPNSALLLLHSFLADDVSPPSPTPWYLLSQPTSKNSSTRVRFACSDKAPRMQLFSVATPLAFRQLLHSTGMFDSRSPRHGANSDHSSPFLNYQQDVLNYLGTLSATGAVPKEPLGEDSPPMVRIPCSRACNTPGRTGF